MDEVTNARPHDPASRRTVSAPQLASAETSGASQP